MTNGARPDFAYAILGFALIVWVGAALSVHPPAPPDVEAEGEVDAERAMRHVERMAVEPHAGGTDANAEVREYLVAELRALGLEPVLDEIPRDGLAPLVNILARVRGTGDGGAVLLQAHYDSRYGAPGAGDNATGVAAVLETLRLVLADGPFENDLIVHLDDGEELGLIGARHFAAEHPWMADVRCVLNFDARGNGGTPVCFEVGMRSSRLIRAFAAGHPRPVAASLGTAVYERMPNDTSFSPFRDAGLPGLNFAFVGGGTAYHKPFDSIENMSRRTLLRMAEYAHATTRAALSMDLSEEGRDVVFFNVGAGGMVMYPKAWTVPLALLPLLLMGLVLVRVRRVGASVVRGVRRAVFVFGLAWGAGVAAWWLVRLAVRAGVAVGVLGGEERGNLMSSTLDAFGSLGVAVAVVLVVLARMDRRAESDGPRPSDGLAVGGALVWCGALVGLAVWMPLAAYVTTWPLLLALPTLAGVLGAERAPRWAQVWGGVSYVVAVTVLAPTFYLLVQVASLLPERVPVFAAGLAGFGLLLYVPGLRRCVAREGHGTAVVAGVLGVGALVAGGIAGASGI